MGPSQNPDSEPHQAEIAPKVSMRGRGVSWLARAGALLAACILATLAPTACGGDPNAGAASTTLGAWTQLEPAGDVPSIDPLAMMVYDPDSTAVILCAPGEAILVTGTWRYDPASGRWKDCGDPIDGPLARTASSLVYDSRSKQVILFGGGTLAGESNDTWAYDPLTNKWTEVQPPGDLPSARRAHAAVYDERAGKMILFGGYLAQSSEDDDRPLNLADDTWAYASVANTWTLLQPGGDSPAPRLGHAMVYDTRSGQVILFGGLTNEGFLNDTWAYDPVTNKWRELHPEGDLPLARVGHAMVFDGRSGQVIMFGGDTDYGLANDTWIYNPAANSWTRCAPTVPLPAPRSSHAMVYDPISRRVFLFGGVGRHALRPIELFDMWAYGLAH